MRKHPFHFRELHSPRRNQVVFNAQAQLRFDPEIVRQHQVKMLGHRTGERILNGNGRCLGPAALQRGKRVA